MRIFIIITVILISSCSSLKNTNNLLTNFIGKNNNPTKISRSTKSFSPVKVSKFIIIPKGLITQSTVIRANTEIRIAPGVQYSILNKILARGTKVLVFEKLGVWTQIIVPQLNIKGWVHKATLSKGYLNKKSMKVAYKLLPVLISISKISKLYSYPKKNQIAKKIGQGTLLINLRKNNQKSLVMLFNSDSPFWVANDYLR